MPARRRAARPSAPTAPGAAPRAASRFGSIGARARSSRAFQTLSGAPAARSSRISSSSSFSANTSSSSAGGTCFGPAPGRRGADPSSCSRYSTRAIGCLQRPVGVVQVRRPLEARPPLGRRRVVEVVGMKLAAERPEPLLELGRVEVQLARQAQESEVVAVPAERQDLRALRAEVRVDGRAAAAITADLNRGAGDGVDIEGSWFRSSRVQAFLNLEP